LIILKSYSLSFSNASDYPAAETPIHAAAKIPIESMEKIRGEALRQQRIEQERVKQEQNMAQFDPDDFDSFDEGEEASDASPSIQRGRDAAIQLEATSTPQQDDSFEEEDVGEQRGVESATELIDKAAEQEQRKNEFLSNRKRIEAMFKSIEVKQVPETKPKVVPVKAPLVVEDPKQAETGNFLLVVVSDEASDGFWLQRPSCFKLDIFYLNFNQFFKEKATNINNICTSLVNNFAKFNFTLKCFYLVKDKNLQPL
jgi:hypothetical protein